MAGLLKGTIRSAARTIRRSGRTHPETLGQGLLRDELSQFALQKLPGMRVIGRNAGQTRNRRFKAAAVGVRQRLSEALAMKTAEILQPRGHRRDADGAAEISHQIEEAEA